MRRLSAYWHTEGRRQPSVLGKDPAGKRLRGGPYTSYQAVGSTVVGLVLFSTANYWGVLVGDKLVFKLAATMAAVFITMRAAARFDYTNVAIVWQVYGGVRTVLRGLVRDGITMSDTKQIVGLKAKPTVVAHDARVLRFVKTSEIETRAEAATMPALLETPIDPHQAEEPPSMPTSPRRFINVARRRPAIPPTPIEPQPAAHPTHDLVTAAQTSQRGPESALQSFLSAATRPSGE